MSGAPKQPALTREQAKLVEGAASLVARSAQYLASRYVGLVTHDDLVSAGHDGLVRAALVYDESRGPVSGGPSFAMFAYKYVNGSMRNAIKRESQQRRHARKMMQAVYEVLEDLVDDADVFNDTADAALDRLRSMADAAVAGMAIGALGDDEYWESPEGRDRAITELHTALDDLPPRDQQLVRMHHFDAKPLKEIAQVLGVSYITARRWHVRCLERLAERVRAAAA